MDRESLSRLAAVGSAKLVHLWTEIGIKQDDRIAKLKTFSDQLKSIYEVIYQLHFQIMRVLVRLCRACVDPSSPGPGAIIHSFTKTKKYIEMCGEGGTKQRKYSK